MSCCDIIAAGLLIVYTRQSRCWGTPGVLIHTVWSASRTLSIAVFRAFACEFDPFHPSTRRHRNAPSYSAQTLSQVCTSCIQSGTLMPRYLRRTGDCHSSSCLPHALHSQACRRTVAQDKEVDFSSIALCFSTPTRLDTLVCAATKYVLQAQVDQTYPRNGIFFVRTSAATPPKSM